MSATSTRPARIVITETLSHRLARALVQAVVWPWTESSASIVRLKSSRFTVAGTVPDHGAGPVLGIDLPEVAPSLRGVDIDARSQDWLDGAIDG